MARIDDYKKALELAKSRLAGKDPRMIAEASGTELKTDSEGAAFLSLPFLGKELSLSLPGLEFSSRDSQEIPIQQQVLLLHYLSGAENSRIQNEWIAYQEVPDGKFYLDAFLRRAKNPMVDVFGEDPELLVRLALSAYGAEPSDMGDASVVVRALPLVPVVLILWKGDDEFPPEGNILFDRGISRILSAEDIAWLAGMIVYPLIGMAKSRPA